MSKHRLRKMEGSLGPKAAVLHWMDEVHGFGSLPAYVESLFEQPEATQPFVAIPRRVQDAVYASMRGERTAAVRSATREAVGDTVFLLGLVLGLNAHVEAVLRVEAIRHASLVWWSRALRAEGTEDKDSCSGWRRGVASFRGVLLGTERARVSAEAKYLDGHACLFPELAVGWQELSAAADAIGDDAAAEDVAACAQQDIEQVVRMARADGLDAAGQYRAADEMADRVVRTMVAEGADG